MPAFILIAGYFSHGFLKKGYYSKIFLKVLLPYVIFQLLYTLYYDYYQGLNFDLQFFTPRWTLWFLVSLFFWKLMIPLFSRFSFLIGMLIAIGLGVGVGYFDGIDRFLSISRTLVFFPFYLLGFHLDKNHFEILRMSFFKKLGLFVFIMMLLVSHTIVPYDFSDWLKGTNVFEHSHDFLYRIAIYLSMALSTFSFLSLNTSKKTRFTHVGKNSFYVFILHGFVVRTVMDSKFAQYLDNYYGYVFILLLAFLTTITLGSERVAKLFHKINM
jgi:fucose 4-O-acetylase-like acetyltransferase